MRSLILVVALALCCTALPGKAIAGVSEAPDASGDSETIGTVPEPAVLLLLGSGLMAVAVVRRRRGPL